MDKKEWFSEEEAAEWMSVPADAVRQAVKDRTLPALVIGGIPRLSREALLALASATSSSQSLERPARPQRPSIDGWVLTPDGLIWTSELTEIGQFTWFWPKQGGGKHAEKYDRAWQGEISILGHPVVVKVGEAVRDGRGRLTVWFDSTPMCEFSDTIGGRGWASLIKPDGKKVLVNESAMPPVYQSAKVQPYREATGLTGIGIPKGLAVVIGREDHVSAVNHAAARWLGRRHSPIQGKYEPLTTFLEEQASDEVTLDFAEIEAHLGGRLPVSARQFREWWDNNPNHHVQARAWLAAGRRVKAVDLSKGVVTFERAE